MSVTQSDISGGRRGNATRADRISEQLAREIMTGALEPGMRLDESELAQRFGVSRTPVREALRELDAMGLAEKRSHRGVIVTSLSVARLQDMFQVMAEIEAVCARLAARNMTPAQRSELEAMHKSSAGLVRDGATEEYAAHNKAFHSAIYQGTDNWFMEETTNWIRRRVSPFRRAQFDLPARLSLSYQEHDAVVQAILRGDEHGAAEAMHQHMMTVSDASAVIVGDPAAEDEA